MDGEKKREKRQLSQVHKTPFLLSVNSLALAAPPLSTALWSLPLLFSLHLSFPLLSNKSKNITCPTIISPYVVHFHLSFPFMLIKLSEIKSSRCQKWNKTLLYKKEGEKRSKCQWLWEETDGRRTMNRTQKQSIEAMREGRCWMEQMAGQWTDSKRKMMQLKTDFAHNVFA